MENLYIRVKRFSNKSRIHKKLLLGLKKSARRQGSDLNMSCFFQIINIICVFISFCIKNEELIDITGEPTPTDNETRAIFIINWR